MPIPLSVTEITSLSDVLKALIIISPSFRQGSNPWCIACLLYTSSKAIEYIDPKKAIVLQPCYSEYIRTIKNNGGTSVSFYLQDNRNFEIDIDKLYLSLQDDIDMLILCNPNNPTSTVIENNQLKTIIKTCYENNVILLVDETYIEFTDNPEELSAIRFCEEYDNLIVIRSTSKFFASPGLRLGYMITSNSEINYKFDDKSDPWSIGSLTELAGRAVSYTHLDVYKRQDIIFLKSLKKGLIVLKVP